MDEHNPIAQLETVYDGLVKLFKEKFSYYPHTLGLLTKLSSIALPNIDDKKFIDIVYTLLSQRPQFFNQQCTEEFEKLIKEPPANELCLRLLINLRDLSQILYKINYRHILHLTNSILPPGPIDTQIKFMSVIAKIFINFTNKKIEEIKGVLLMTNQNYQTIQIGI